MFGPNCSVTLNQKILFHHREPSFMNVFARLGELFHQKFGIGHDWDILFISASGTAAIEAAISSLTCKVRIPETEGDFTQRLTRMAKLYGKYDANADQFCDVELETSISQVRRKKGALFLDAVSSFPYYDIPEGTKIFATVSGKQLGATPVLGIVAVHSDAWRSLRDTSEYSFLNLARYRESLKIGQTPHTASMSLFMDFLEKLDALDVLALRAKINQNSDELVRIFGKERVIGETRCPVITVKKSVIPEVLARKYHLYGTYTSSPNYQIFTYAETQDDYDRLFSDLRRGCT